MNAVKCIQMRMRFYLVKKSVMKISRAIAIKIILWHMAHPGLELPFTLMNQEYGDEDDDFNEIIRDDYENVIDDP